MFKFKKDLSTSDELLKKKKSPLSNNNNRLKRLNNIFTKREKVIKRQKDNSSNFLNIFKRDNENKLEEETEKEVLNKRSVEHTTNTSTLPIVRFDYDGDIPVEKKAIIGKILGNFK